MKNHRMMMFPFETPLQDQIFHIYIYISQCKQHKGNRMHNFFLFDFLIHTILAKEEDFSSLFLTNKMPQLHAHNKVSEAPELTRKSLGSI